MKSQIKELEHYIFAKYPLMTLTELQAHVKTTNFDSYAQAKFQLVNIGGVYGNTSGAFVVVHHQESKEVCKTVKNVAQDISAATVINIENDEACKLNFCKNVEDDSMVDSFTKDINSGKVDILFKPNCVENTYNPSDNDENKLDVAFYESLGYEFIIVDTIKTFMIYITNGRVTESKFICNASIFCTNTFTKRGESCWMIKYNDANKRWGMRCSFFTLNALHDKKDNIKRIELFITSILDQLPSGANCINFDLYKFKQDKLLSQYYVTYIMDSVTNSSLVCDYVSEYKIHLVERNNEKRYYMIHSGGIFDVTPGIVNQRRLSMSQIRIFIDYDVIAKSFTYSLPPIIPTQQYSNGFSLQFTRYLIKKIGIFAFLNYFIILVGMRSGMESNQRGVYCSYLHVGLPGKGKSLAFLLGYCAYGWPINGPIPMVCGVGSTVEFVEDRAGKLPHIPITADDLTNNNIPVSLNALIMHVGSMFCKGTRGKGKNSSTTASTFITGNHEIFKDKLSPQAFSRLLIILFDVPLHESHLSKVGQTLDSETLLTITNELPRHLAYTLSITFNDILYKQVNDFADDYIRTKGYDDNDCWNRCKEFIVYNISYATHICIKLCPSLDVQFVTLMYKKHTKWIIDFMYYVWMNYVEKSNKTSAPTQLNNNNKKTAVALTISLNELYESAKVEARKKYTILPPLYFINVLEDDGIFKCLAIDLQTVKDGTYQINGKCLTKNSILGILKPLKKSKQLIVDRKWGYYARYITEEPAYIFKIDDLIKQEPADMKLLINNILQGNKSNPNKRKLKSKKDSMYLGKNNSLINTNSNCSVVSNNGKIMENNSLYPSITNSFESTIDVAISESEEKADTLYTNDALDLMENIHQKNKRAVIASHELHGKSKSNAESEFELSETKLENSLKTFQNKYPESYNNYIEKDAQFGELHVAYNFANNANNNSGLLDPTLDVSNNDDAAPPHKKQRTI